MNPQTTRYAASAFRRLRVPTPRRHISFCLTNSQTSLKIALREFVLKEMAPLSHSHDVSGDFPSKLFQKAWERGFVNIHIPVALGGLGLGGVEGVITCEELAYGDIGMMIGMEINSVAEIPVIIAGSPNQKKSFLGRMLEAPLQERWG